MKQMFAIISLIFSDAMPRAYQRHMSADLQQFIYHMYSVINKVLTADRDNTDVEFKVISRVVFLTNMSTTRAKCQLVIRTISCKSNLFLFKYRHSYTLLKGDASLRALNL
jgi:hypothetical protein